MSLMLPPEFESFVHTRVASGVYASEQDVLRTAFGLLEKHESLLAHIDEGSRQLQAGEYAEYSVDDREKFLSDIAAAATRLGMPDK